MNFLKAFYLTVSLLGCVNLVAMQEVPSDEEIEACIAEIIKNQEGIQRYTVIDDSKPFAVWITSMIQAGKSLIPSSNNIPNKFIIFITPDESMNAAVSAWGLFINLGLLKKCSVRELRVIIAHEVGHWAFGHTKTSTKTLLGKMVHKCIPMLDVSKYETLIFHSYLTLMFLSIEMLPLENFTTKFLARILAYYLSCPLWYNKDSIRQEFEADAFAMQLTRDAEALESFIVKAEIDDTNTLWKKIAYNSLSWFGVNTHPHITDRIAHIKKVICELTKQE